MVHISNGSIVLHFQHSPHHCSQFEPQFFRSRHLPCGINPFVCVLLRPWSWLHSLDDHFRALPAGSTPCRHHCGHPCQLGGKHNRRVLLSKHGKRIGISGEVLALHQIVYNIIVYISCNSFCDLFLQAFVPFMIAIAIFLVILYIYLPETKGKTVESITSVMAGPGAWSGKYNRATSAQETHIH